MIKKYSDLRLRSTYTWRQGLGRDDILNLHEDSLPKLYIYSNGNYLNINNIDVDYTDLTYGVYDNGKLLPVFACKEKPEDGFDAYPLLSIGFAELLQSQVFVNNFNKVSLCRYADAVCINKAVDYISNIIELPFARCVDNALGLLGNARSNYMGPAWPAVQALANTYLFSFTGSVSVFIDVLMEIFQRLVLSAGYNNPDFKIAFDWDSVFERNSTRHESLPEGHFASYNYNGKRWHVTDIRGIALYYTMNWIAEVIRKFCNKDSYHPSIQFLISDNFHEFCMSHMMKCWGDDRVVKYFSDPSKEWSKPNLRYFKGMEWGICMLETGVTADTASDEFPTVSDVNTRFGRDCLASFKAANSVRTAPGVYRNRYSCTSYFTSDTAVAYLGKLYAESGIIVDNEDIRFDHDRFLDKHGRSLADLKSLALAKFTDFLNASIEADKEAEKLKSVEATFKHRYEDMKANYESQISDLKKKLEESDERIKSEKQKQIELREEVNVFKSILSEEFYDDEVSFDSDELPTIEDMVTELNKHSVVLLGGREDLISKLKEAGWFSFKRVDNDYLHTGKPIQADFICINTKFVSHKLVYKIKSQYKELSDNLIYFNGINTNQLITVMYKAVTKSSGGSNV